MVVLNHNTIQYSSFEEVFSMFPVFAFTRVFVTVPMYRFQWKWCCVTSEIWLEKTTQLLLTYLTTLTPGAFTNCLRSLTVSCKPLRKPTRRDTERCLSCLGSSYFRLPSSGSRPHLQITWDCQCLRDSKQELSDELIQFPNLWGKYISVLTLHHSCRLVCCRTIDNWNISYAEYQSTSPSSGNMGGNMVYIAHIPHLFQHFLWKLFHWNSGSDIQLICEH